MEPANLPVDDSNSFDARTSSIGGLSPVMHVSSLPCTCSFESSCQLVWFLPSSSSSSLAASPPPLPAFLPLHLVLRRTGSANVTVKAPESPGPGAAGPPGARNLKAKISAG
eukprot:746332-Hanusia_phi.AAC.15